MEIKRKWIFIFLLVGGVTIQDSSACVCWDQLNSTMRSMIPITGAPVPDLPDYNYLGVETSSTGALQNCICADVIRLQSTFDISDDNLFNATNVNTTDDLEVNITNTLRSMLQSEIDAGNVVTIEVLRNTSSAITYPDTQWKIDIVLKGRSSIATRINTIENLLKTGSSLNTDGTYNFGGVADVNGADFKFKALTCLNTPPVALQDGSRVWTAAMNYPGGSAKYSCNAGFFLSGVTTASQTAFSNCSHSTLMWTDLGSTVACKKGCQGEPPEPPFFAVKKWDSTERNEGDEVLYICMTRYRPKLPDTLPNTTSTCTNSAWTAFDARFGCELILCPKNITQVPAFANTTWDRETVSPGTTFVYYCRPGYKSRMGTVTVSCLENGEWEKPPKNFKCFNKYDDQAHVVSQVDLADYDMAELPQEQLFLIVSVPSIIGLIILIFCCLCCCRTDSYVFLVCTGNARKINYIHD